MWKKVKGEKNEAQFDLICGVPYTALPFATCLSLEHNIPLLMRRKEGPKDYGTKKSIEGVYKKGQEVLVIEDLVTSGSSVLEVVDALKEEGLVVKDIVVFLDREQGALKEIESRNLKLHSVFQFSQVLKIMEEEELLDKTTCESIRNFLQKNQTSPKIEHWMPKPVPFSTRALKCTNPVGVSLFQLMENKKTNLCVSVDVTKKDELLDIVDKVGDQICLLKTHIDIIEDFDQDLIRRLQDLSIKHNFLIFEDRKFADIGNTVKLQYGCGIYHTADWAHVVNAHILPGQGIIQGLREIGKPKQRGLLLIAEMSSEGSLATDSYTDAAVKMAEANKDFVIGFICGKKLSDDFTLLHITPGVQFQTGGDSLGQTYRTPEDVIANGTDIIIVGRGITSAPNIKETASNYRNVAWTAYEKRFVNMLPC
jgi:uridine monophosphate synthetase